MAFIGLAFAFVLVCIIGAVVLTAIIFLVIGLAKRNNGKRYPKVLITLGLIVLIPFTVMVVVGSIRAAIHRAENRKNLYYCVVNGEFRYAKKLIDQGASPERAANINVTSNAPVPDGQDSLLIHFCMREDSSEAVAFLIQNGADVNRRTWEHERDYAGHSGNAGFGYQSGDNCGKTPLMAAAATGNVQSVELLIEGGADVNATDYFGKTALMYAASSHQGDDAVQIAELLVKNGADLNTVDHFGQTVWDYAERHGMENVINALKQAQ